MVLIKRPGPKKVEPFDPSVLDTEIRLLDHGRKRSAGTTELIPTVPFQCVTAGAGADGGAGAAGPGGGSSCRIFAGSNG